MSGQHEDREQDDVLRAGSDEAVKQMVAKFLQAGMIELDESSRQLRPSYEGAMFVNLMLALCSVMDIATIIRAGSLKIAQKAIEDGLGPTAALTSRILKSYREAVGPLSPKIAQAIQRGEAIDDADDDGEVAP